MGLSAKIKEVTGPVSYNMELLQDGVVLCLHQVHLKNCHVDLSAFSKAQDSHSSKAIITSRIYHSGMNERLVMK